MQCTEPVAEAQLDASWALLSHTVCIHFPPSLSSFMRLHLAANIVLPDHPQMTQSWIKGVELQHKSPPKSVEAG